MNETHEIRIIARDGTTQVFKAISREAKAAGLAGEDAGKRGSKGMKDWATAGRNTGLALGALTAVAVRASNEAEAIQRQLQQSVENTGESYEALEGRIDAMNKTALKFAFDDEDASAALASLTDATGNATFALNDMNLVMDIARGRNIDLGAAARIVAAAEQGRYGSLARLGIQIDDNASREEALGALQAKYAGQAQAYAETNAAAWDRMGNSASNALERVGGALGDVALPLMALGAVAGPIGSLAGALGGSAGLAAGLTAAGAAAAPFLVTMGALAAPIGIATYLIMDQDDVMRRAAETTAENNKQLQAYIGWLNKIATADVNVAEFQGTEADQFLDWLTKTTVGGMEVIDTLQGIPVVVSDIEDELRTLTPQQLDAVLQLAKDLGIVFNDPNTWSPDAISALVTVIEEQADITAEAAYTAFELTRAQNRMQDSADGAADANERLNRAEVAEIRTSEASTAAKTAEVIAYMHATKVSGEHSRALQMMTGANDSLAASVKETEDTLIAEARALLSAGQAMQSMSGSTAALDGGIRTIIGGIDDLGGGIAKVETNLSGLTDASDGWSQLDQLVSEGRISWDEYNAALKAVGDTQFNANEATLDAATINAKLSPILAELAWKQGLYVDEISRLPAEEQLVALAYMDTARAAQALEIQTQLAAAAAGDLGEGGKVAMKEWVRGIAEADPGMQALLEDMGLISVGAEGTVKINWPEDGVSEMERLTMSIDALTVALGGIPPNTEAKVSLDTEDVDTGIVDVTAQINEWGNVTGTAQAHIDDSNANAALFRLQTITIPMIDASVGTATVDADEEPALASIANANVALTDLDGNYATTYVQAVDQASGVLGGVSSLLDSLSGRIVTTYVQSVSLGTQGGFMHGGMIEPAAHGRVMGGNALALVGETGPELVSLPYGSHVTPSASTRYKRGEAKGDGGQTIHIANLTVMANDARQFAQSMRQYEQGGRNA